MLDPIEDFVVSLGIPARLVLGSECTYSSLSQAMPKKPLRICRTVGCSKLTRETWCELPTDSPDLCYL